MYKMLIKLIVAVTLLELGINISSFKDCPSRACLIRIEKASRQVLKIDWKPISVFPEEARRFR
jgi:hypothetical protein